MSLLNRRQIKQLSTGSQRLIDPFDEQKLRSASYDLSVGEEYYFYRPEHRGNVQINKLRNHNSFSIPPNAICYVLSEECLNLPLHVAGSLSLRVGLMKQGILLPRQTQIDPGSRGKLVAMLYNLSSDPVTLRRGEHLMTIEFLQLQEVAEEGYHGAYLNLTTLQDFIDRPVKGSLDTLHENLARAEKRVERALPIMLATIAILLTIITAIVAVMAIAISINLAKGGRETSQQPLGYEQVERLRSQPAPQPSQQDTTESPEGRQP